jgi:hypothetical protein
MLASPRRIDPEHFRYARACLSQGMSYPAASRASGINETDLREAVPGYATHRPAPPPAILTPLEQCAAALALATPAECGQMAALALAALHERSGLNAARFACANIMAAIPSLIPTDVTPARRIIAREVAEYVAAMHDLTFDQMQSVLRPRGYARPRQIAMYSIKRLCPHMSYPAIGRLLGNRDHTTILHGDRKIVELVQSDPDIANAVARVFDRFAPQAQGEAA